LANKYKDRRVGVIMGGLSEEREISLKTGTAILGALKDRGYDVVAVDAGKDLASRLVKEKIEVAFVALHGRYGEDGCVQGLLEVMGIPYTGSGVRASAMCMDKVTAKSVMLHNAISTAAYEVLDDKKGPRLKLPYVLKPVSQGSGIGVVIVRKKSQLPAAIKEAGAHGCKVFAESYVEGRELTVSIMDGRVLPVVEIRPKDGFYDFEHKYTKGKTEYVVPARLAKKVEARVQKEALAAYRVLGCAGGARVDVMLSKMNVPYVLEVNTVPGMTELSIFPMAAGQAGLDFGAMAAELLNCAGLDKA